MYRYQYFQFQDCGANRYTKSDFTGTRVLSVSPIGVVSGNCETSSKGEYHFMSHVEEMLFPMTNWGYHYYFMTPESTADTRLRIMSHTAAEIKLLANGTRNDITLSENDTYVERFVESGAQILMTSDAPICVVMFSTEVTDHQSGDLSMVQVIPNENWLNWYYVSVPTVRNKKLAVILTVLLLTKDLFGLHIDFSSGLTTNVRPASSNHSRLTTRVDTLRGYTALTIPLDDSSIHVIYHVDGRKFGCYVKMSLSPGHVYIPAGSMLRDVERYRGQCLKSQWYVTGEDMVDNDCDGFVDEENINNEDDDFDGKIDEDIGVVNGSWSAWSIDPFCSVPCRRTMGKMGYFRTCTEPEPSLSGLQCDGQDFKPMDGPEQKCNTVDVKCPEECSNNTWYFGCVNKCPEGCLDTCNKLTGRCRACKPGFPMTEDHKCNLDLLALSNGGNETLDPEESQPPNQGGGGGGSGAQGENSSIPHLGWKIYATIIYVGAIIILGIVYEVYKRYKK
ncbi:hypothetical protein Btru_044136 [Bulinus truncatus]|nr:hypothetical protein Btru_044136 [Bulinus truncatus]